MAVSVAVEVPQKAGHVRVICAQVVYRGRPEEEPERVCGNGEGLGGSAWSHQEFQSINFTEFPHLGARRPAFCIPYQAVIGLVPSSGWGGHSPRAFPDEGSLSDNPHWANVDTEIPVCDKIIRKKKFILKVMYSLI